MPCNSNHSRRAQTPNSKGEPSTLLTLWEKFVLWQAAKHSKVMVFDFEFEDHDGEEPGMGNHLSGLGANDGVSDLDPATSVVMSEEQAQKATTRTSSSSSTPTTPQNQHPDPEPAKPTTRAPSPSPIQEPKAKARLPPAFLASLDSVRALSQNAKHNNKSTNDTPTSQTPTSTSASPKNKTHQDIIFGPTQAARLSPTALDDDTARQEALIRNTRWTDGLPTRRGLGADEEGVYGSSSSSVGCREADLMMSGALEAGDPRCEVCEKREREREVEGLVEGGVLAL